MKKITTVMISILLIITILCGCSHSKTKLEKTTYHPTQVNNVMMSISDVSSTSATLKIKDTNKEPFVYGEWYKIEQKKNEQWYNVNTIIDDYGFEDIGCLTNDNNEVIFNIEWEWLYGKLPQGNYRLLKEIDNNYISVEFCIS